MFGDFNKIPKPISPRQQHIMQQHGDTRDDEYYWLNARDSVPVVKYLNEENAYYNAVIKLNHSSK